MVTRNLRAAWKASARTPKPRARGPGLDVSAQRSSERLVALTRVAPQLLQMESVNPVWLGVLMAVNLQTSYMHPPLGPTLFFLRGAAPPEITTRHIYVGIIPFVLIQLAMLIVLWFAPGLATALPHLLYGS